MIDSLGGQTGFRSHDALRHYGHLINIGEAEDWPREEGLRDKLYERSTSFAGFETMAAMPGSDGWNKGRTVHSAPRLPMVDYRSRWREFMLLSSARKCIAIWNRAPYPASYCWQPALNKAHVVTEAGQTHRRDSDVVPTCASTTEPHVGSDQTEFRSGTPSEPETTLLAGLNVSRQESQAPSASSTRQDSPAAACVAGRQDHDAPQQRRQKDIWLHLSETFPAHDHAG